MMDVHPPLAPSRRPQPSPTGAIVTLQNRAWTVRALPDQQPWNPPRPSSRQIHSCSAGSVSQPSRMFIQWYDNYLSVRPKPLSVVGLSQILLLQLPFSTVSYLLHRRIAPLINPVQSFFVNTGADPMNGVGLCTPQGHHWSSLLLLFRIAYLVPLSRGIQWVRFAYLTRLALPGTLPPPPFLTP